MNNIALIGKITGCIGAAGGVSGVGYYLYSNDYFKSSKNDDLKNSDKADSKTQENKSEQKVIAPTENNSQSSTHSESTDAEETYLLKYIADSKSSQLKVDTYTTNNENIQIKNFQCKLFSVQEIIDETCEIYSINKNTSKKYLDLSSLHKSSNQIKKYGITDNNYFKLKIKNKKFTQNFTYEKTIINIKSTAESNLSFGKMQVLAKINENEVKTVNKKILVQAKSSIKGNNEDVNNYICQIPNTTTSKHKFHCSIFKLQNNPNNLQSLNFSRVTKISKTNEIKENSYYLIDFQEHGNIDEITDEILKKNITFFNVDNHNEINFNFFSHVWGQKDTSDESNNSFFILKNLETK